MTNSYLQNSFQGTALDEFMYHIENLEPSLFNSLNGEKAQKNLSELKQELKKWMFALLDILDGSASAHDIHYNTGLSMERCEEISKMFYEATKDGWPNRD